MTDLTYFARYGKMIHPGPYVYLYNDLPSEVPTLVEVVQGLMLHVFWAERYGLNLPEERKGEVQHGTLPGSPALRVWSVFPAEPL
jgi:hypothetical protein